MLLRKPTPAVLTVTRAGLHSARAGFTLMELLVVVAILVVLIGVATPMYLNYLERSKLRIARAEAVRLKGLLSNYAAEHDGQYPQPGDWTGLPLEAGKVPPLDPWNNPFQWQLIPTLMADGTELMTPVVWSSGPNGNMGPNDQCSSAHQGP